MAVLVAPVVVPITIEALVRFEFDRTGRRSSDYIPQLDIGLQASAARLFQDLEVTRSWMAAYFGSRVATDAAWELVSTDRARLMLHPLLEPLLRVLARTVTEQPTLVTWYPMGVDGPSLELVCTEIELQEGSLKANIKAFIGGVGFAITTMAGLLAAGPVQKVVVDHEVRQNITQKYRGESCFSETTYKISATALMHAAAQDLNYFDDVDDKERQRRLCLVQGMLNATGHYPGQLDGKDGPLTQHGLERVQKDHHLSSHSIEDVEVRRALYSDWHDFLGKLRRDG